MCFPKQVWSKVCVGCGKKEQGENKDKDLLKVCLDCATGHGAAQGRPYRTPGPEEHICHTESCSCLQVVHEDLQKNRTWPLMFF